MSMIQKARAYFQQHWLRHNITSLLKEEWKTTQGVTHVHPQIFGVPAPMQVKMIELLYYCL